ncbi:MAG TPA: hypothetical protein VFG08_09370, partial [Candidatus Polarisedimenticolia bacterium]|nr:hypothetical protein [Candidatus Polarisedimenticolia bacterium]
MLGSAGAAIGVFAVAAAAGSDVASRLVKSVAAEPKFSCTFATAPTDCGFRVQEKVPGRASIVNFGRDGGTAVRLHTRPGDSNVAGSRDMQRT